MVQIEDFEDLTQFADESFDTDEVDLFEFTDDDDSPLLRLKSIVLSLDWDITDETLVELNDELNNLRSLWADDKVSQIYLQALDNVGKYLQSEGAYAHTNAIKLLLTLFYNFEKIISSSTISGEEITALLKQDIRKFKVLQYQIGNMEGAEGGKGGEVPPPEVVEEPKEDESKVDDSDDPLTRIQATILGLEWEVTDKGLEQFNSEALELREHLEDKNAQVLVQGLLALGSYIREEKTHAHPDAFTILHSFYDGLKSLVDDKGLTDAQRKQILVDRVSSLNSLKEIIAEAAREEQVEQVAEQEEAPVEETLDLDNKEKEPFGDADDELTIDFDDLESTEREVEFDDDADSIASLSDGDEDDDDDADLSFFDDITDDQAAGVSATSSQNSEEDLLDPDAIEPVANKIADDLIDEELMLSSDVASPTDDADSEELEIAFDGESDLDLDDSLFFTDDDDSAAGDSPPVVAALDDVTAEESAESFDSGVLGEDREAELSDKLDSFFDLDDVEEEDEAADDAGLDNVLSLDLDEEDEKEGTEADSSVAALDDSDETDGFFADIDTEEDEGGDELDDKLDSFFDLDDDIEEEEVLTAVDTDKDDPLALDDELVSALDEMVDSPDSADTVVSALDDTDEEGGFAVDNNSAELGEKRAAELDSKLDSFFGLDEDEVDEEINDASDLALGEPPEEDKLDTNDFVLDDAVEDVAFDTSDLELDDDSEEDMAFDTIGLKLEDDSDKENSGADAADDRALNLDDDLAFALDEMQNSPTEDTVVSALDDTEEEGGFAIDLESADLGEERAIELDSKLDSFFGLDDEIEEETVDEESTAVADTAEDISLEQDAELVSALDEESDSSEEADSKELSASLDEDDEDVAFTDFFSSVDGEEDADSSVELELGAELKEENSESGISDDEKTNQIAGTVQETKVEADDVAVIPAEEVTAVEESVISAGLGEDRLAELDDKLDSFFDFEVEDDESAGEEVELDFVTDDTVEEEELLLEAVDEEPIAATTESSSLSESEDLQLSEEMEIEPPVADTVADIVPEPDDRKEKLNSFFDSSEEGDVDTAAVTGQAASGLEPDNDEGSSLPLAVTALTSLAAVAAGISGKPDPEVIEEVQELAAAGKEQANTSQTVLLTLLDAAVNLISQHEIENDGSDALIKELTAGLADADSPTTLINAVTHFTNWQQELFKKVVAGSVAAPAELEPADNSEAIVKVQEGFSQLRATMVEEFTAIREELKKK